MKTLIRVGKWLGALIAAGILFLLVASNFGTVESRLVCSGEVQRQVGNGDAVTTPATLYARVETYRWILFWFEHDAMISWEIQPGGDLGFGYYNASDFATSITDLNRAKTYGNLSRLSSRIYVLTSIDGDEAFAGMCK